MQIKETVLKVDVVDNKGPYLIKSELVQRVTHGWNKDFDQDADCDCGHSYYRHFDTYEDMAAVGCKYCPCLRWSTPVKKAGLIPFYVNDAYEIMMAFMVSSDPFYGGPLPQISKGNVDPEDKGSKNAAMREAEEELGYVPYSDWRMYRVHEVYDVYTGTIKGMEGEHSFKLYVNRVDPTKFKQHHYETREVVWMSPSDFQLRGREEHKELVRIADEKIREVLRMEEELSRRYNLGMLPPINVVIDDDPNWVKAEWTE